MPNWCTNRVTITGPKKVLDEVRAFMKGENGDFDFNQIVPMPEILKRTIFLGARSFKLADGAKLDVRAWIKDRETGEERPFTEEELVELKHIGSKSWYDWANSHWGTKWNANSAAVEQTTRSLKFVFDTAWAPPQPVFERLAERFPAIKIRNRWEEEGGESGHNQY